MGRRIVNLDIKGPGAMPAKTCRDCMVDITPDPKWRRRLCRKCLAIRQATTSRLIRSRGNSENRHHLELLLATGGRF